MLKSFHGFHLTANSTDDDDQITLSFPEWNPETSESDEEKR